MGWLGGWLSRSVRDRASFQVPVGISLGGLAVALSLRIRHEERPACPWLWFLLPSVSGIVFWFIAAPGLRFAQFAFWTAAGTLGAWGAVSVASKFKQDFRSAFLMAIAAAMIWTLFSFGWKAPYSTLLKTKSLPAMPQANTNMKRTSSGLAVYMPDEGNQCWEAALPCTPYFDETLRLRSEQSMSSGFQSKLQARNLVRFEK